MHYTIYKDTNYSIVIHIRDAESVWNYRPLASLECLRFEKFVVYRTNLTNGLPGLIGGHQLI